MTRHCFFALACLILLHHGCNERAELNRRHAQGESDAEIDGVYRKPEEFTIPYSKSKIQLIDCTILKDREIPKDSNAHCYRLAVPDNILHAYAKVLERILDKKELAYEYVGYLGGPVRENVDEGIETIEVNTIWVGSGNDESKKKCLEIRDAVVGFVSRRRWSRMKGEPRRADSDEDFSPVTTPDSDFKMKEDHPLQPGVAAPAVLEHVTLTWMKFHNIFRLYPIDQFSRADAYKFTSDLPVQAGVSHLVEGDKFKIRAGRALAVSLCEKEQPKIENDGIIFYVEQVPTR